MGGSAGPVPAVEPLLERGSAPSTQLSNSLDGFPRASRARRATHGSFPSRGSPRAAGRLPCTRRIQMLDAQRTGGADHPGRSARWTWWNWRRMSARASSACTARSPERGTWRRSNSSLARGSGGATSRSRPMHSHQLELQFRGGPPPSRRSCPLPLVDDEGRRGNAPSRAVLQEEPDVPVGRLLAEEADMDQVPGVTGEGVRSRIASWNPS